MTEITLKIKTMDMNTFTCTISDGTNVGDLKNLIEEKHQINSNSQRLIFGGRVLQNENTIKHYNIEHDCTIHLVKTDPLLQNVEREESFEPATSIPEDSPNLHDVIENDENDSEMISDLLNSIGLSQYVNDPNASIEIEVESTVVYDSDIEEDEDESVVVEIEFVNENDDDLDGEMDGEMEDEEDEEYEYDAQDYEDEENDEENVLNKSEEEILEKFMAEYKDESTKNFTEKVKQLKCAKRKIFDDFQDSIDEDYPSDTESFYDSDSDSDSDFFEESIEDINGACLTPDCGFKTIDVSCDNHFNLNVKTVDVGVNTERSLLSCDFNFIFTHEWCEMTALQKGLMLYLIYSFFQVRGKKSMEIHGRKKRLEKSEFFSEEDFLNDLNRTRDFIGENEEEEE